MKNQLSPKSYNPFEVIIEECDKIMPNLDFIEIELVQALVIDPNSYLDDLARLIVEVIHKGLENGSLIATNGQVQIK